GHDRVLGEGGRPHIMMQHPAPERESTRAVGHDALPLRREERSAEVRPAAETELAVATFGNVERDHVVAGGERRDARADVLDDPAALVAEHGGEEPRRIAAA